MSPFRAALLASICLIALAACGSDSKSSNSPTDTGAATTAPAAPEVAVRYESIGGCQMMGPNCPTYVVYTDGKVEVSRTGETTGVEVTGSIPEAEVKAFLDSLKDVDLTDLGTGPGTCQSCLDGVDTKLTVLGPDGPVTFDSTVIAFDPANAFFANVEKLMTDVQAVGELPIKQRG